MTQLACCPTCGSPPPGTGGRDGDGALRSLEAEVRRIRELAEARQSQEEAQHSRERRSSELLIAELTREVAELRATVARLRGSARAELGHRL